MDIKTYTITPNGKGAFEIQINRGARLGTTYERDLKTRELANDWVDAHKGARDKVINK
jgi:hypothetical protein